MKITSHSQRIFFSLIFCAFCTVNAGIGSTIKRWFPRQPVNSSVRPSNLRPFVGVTQQDEQLFNQTLSHILVPRVPGTDSHDKVAQYILNYMNKYNWDVEEDKFRSRTPMGQKPFNNIIATLNPDGCKKVVVACHYDSKYFADFEFLAASDSAVPCTMMLELVRVLDLPLKRSIPKDVALQFVFFDGEEAFVQWSRTDSTYGSRHLAAKWRKEGPKTRNCPSSVKNELSRIDLFILLDLIGEKDSTFCNSYRQAAPFYSHLMDIESRLRRNSLMEGHHSNGGFFQRQFCGFTTIEDDQLPFEMNGVRKILHLIAVPFPQVWHKKGDDGSMIHHPTVNNLMKVFRVFLIEHLHLKI